MDDLNLSEGGEEGGMSSGENYNTCNDAYVCAYCTYSHIYTRVDINRE